MKAWLWKFLAGCVTIKVEGLKLLQFVSDAAAQGIRLHRLDRDSYSRMLAEVTWRDYNRLLKLAHNRPLRVVELSNDGLPAIASKVMKRLAFSIGMLACVAVLIGANQFVLDVRVMGCTDPGLEARVLEIAREQGLRPVAGKASVDLHRIETELMLQLSDISFASIRVNGVVATVNVVEGVQAPVLIDKGKPCNVIASRDGVVRKVILYDGQARVVAGDTVKRGQVLVDSAVAAEEGVKYVHARAEVMASVWMEGRGIAPLFLSKSNRTGNVAQRQWLEFAGFVLPIGGQGPSGFERHDTEETAQYLLGTGLKGPRLVTERYYEAYRAIEEKDFDAAMAKALRQALDGALAVVPDGSRILGSRTDYDYSDGYIIVRVFIETLENIAVETPLS